MAKYTPVNRWNDNIHEIGLSEPVEVSVANLPHHQIADNILNLSVRIKALEENLVGDWVVKKLTSEPQSQGTARRFSIQHSAGRRSEYKVTYWQRKGDNGVVSNKTVMPASETNASGYATINCPLLHPLDTYDQIVFEVSAENTTTETTSYSTSLPDEDPIVYWKITTSDATPFNVGDTPTFKLTNSSQKGASVSWEICDLQKSATEGDTETAISSGTGDADETGSLTIQSAALPETGGASPEGHVIVVRTTSGVITRAEFPLSN